MQTSLRSFVAPSLLLVNFDIDSLTLKSADLIGSKAALKMEVALAVAVLHHLILEGIFVDCAKHIIRDCKTR